MKNIEKKNRYWTTSYLIIFVTKVNLTDHWQQPKFIKHVKIQQKKNHVRIWAQVNIELIDAEGTIARWFNRWIINHLRCFPQTQNKFWVILVDRKNNQERCRFMTKHQNKTFNREQVKFI